MFIVFIADAENGISPTPLEKEYLASRYSWLTRQVIAWYRQTVGYERVAQLGVREDEIREYQKEAFVWQNSFL